MVIQFSQSFTGGMNIDLPTHGRLRYEVPMPAARLVIMDDELRLHTQPWVRRIPTLMFSLTNGVAIQKADVDRVFRSLGLFRWGVGFRLRNGKTHYFWTFDSRTVLGELGRWGYTVGPDERPGIIEPLGLPRVGGHAEQATTD